MPQSFELTAKLNRVEDLAVVDDREAPVLGRHGLAAVLQVDDREPTSREADRGTAIVDVHSFAPAELSRAAERAGLREVRVTGEELLANWFGWANRALEATANPDEVPWAWKVYAFKGYLALQRVDRRLLEPYLPAAIFYNLIVSATKR